MKNFSEGKQVEATKQIHVDSAKNVGLKQQGRLVNAVNIMRFG